MLVWEVSRAPHLGGHAGGQAERLFGEQVEEGLELVHNVQQAAREDRHPHLSGKDADHAQLRLPAVVSMHVQMQRGINRSTGHGLGECPT